MYNEGYTHRVLWERGVRVLLWCIHPEPMSTARHLFPFLAICIAATGLAQSNQFDSRIDTYVGLRYPCDGSVQPVLRVQNVGGETMTSCDIDILKNGVADNTFNWILGVPAAPNEFRQPALPVMTGVQPGDLLEFRILTVNGQPDQGSTENIKEFAMTDEKGDADSYQVQVKVLTDDNPEETSWAIKNALGATVAQSPVYSEPGDLRETSVTLASDQCYNFEVYDSGADGFGESRELGYAKLVSLGEDVAVATGAFGSLYRKVAQTGTENGCVPSQLTTTADPLTSCGANGLVLGSSHIHATAVPGANKYMFRFTNIPGQPAYSRNNTSPTRSLAINNWSTLPLKKGRTYNVQVRASFDDGATWCDYGTSCTIRISYALAMQERTLEASEALMEEPLFNIYPNPSESGAINITVNAHDEEEPMFVETFDLMGNRIGQARMFAVSEEGTVLVEQDRALASGIYLVRITVGGSVTTERLMVR